MSELWVFGLAMWGGALTFACLGALLWREIVEGVRRVRWWQIQRHAAARAKALDRQWAREQQEWRKGW